MSHQNSMMTKFDEGGDDKLSILFAWLNKNLIDEIYNYNF